MSGVWVIANPNAANGRAERALSKLEAALRDEGVAYTLQRTVGPGHATELALAARAAHADRILIVGGDGTVHETVAGLLDAEAPPDAKAPAVRPPPFALLPVGTGNDFHRMVRSAAGIADAVRALETGSPRAFEVGEVRWDGGTAHVVNLVGVGIDVEVLRRRAAFGRLPGLLQYLAAFASAFVRYRPIPVRVTLRRSGRDPLRVETPVLLAAVTVGPSVGGGFLLSPKARPDDGVLDLFMVEALGLLGVLRYLPGILRGSTAERPGIWQLQGATVDIEALDARGLAFELDGELVEASTPFLSVEVKPASIEVLEPSEAGR